MLQAPCYSQPLVYGHSHFKKFWLRQTESEDDAAFATQHVSSCSQKFSALSTPITSSMAAPGQNSTPCCNVSLAACANSFSAPRSPSVGEVGSGISKDDFGYNEFEVHSEGGAVDCTLSLGTGKRDGSETPTGLSRSGSPAQEVSNSTLFSSKAQWQSVALDAQVNFIRDCPSDCIRDIYPQSAIPLRLPRTGSAQTCLDNSRFKSHTPDNASYKHTGSPAREGYVPAQKVTTFATDDLSDSGALNYLAEDRKDSPRAVPPRSVRPTVLIPEVGGPEGKYGELPSSLASAGVASPASGQSSVSGDERRCPQRTSDLELIGSGVGCGRSVGRTCAHCGTMKTPLWRNGPQGPKSLCNACGIRFKKAGKRNSSNGNSSELPGSLPSSPVSVKLSPGKSSKRKTDYGVSRGAYPDEVGETAKGCEQFPKMWKRNRLCGGRSSFESSGSEGDEAAGSSGTSCVTCHTRAASSTCIVPVLSVAPLADGNHSSLSRFLPIDELMFSAEFTSKVSDSSKMKFAQDEEEGAKLLMALSCGLVNA